MTTILLEKPLYIGVLGALASIALAYFWLQTGHKRLLQLLAGTVLLTLVLLAVERAVETDREAVRSTLFEIASLVEANDAAAALQFLHASSKLHEETAAGLSQYQLRRAQINQNLDVQIEAGRQAKAAFNAVVVVAVGTPAAYLNRPIPFRMEVTLIPEGDRWKVLDYSVDHALRR